MEEVGISDAAGGVGFGVGPFFGEGLDEAFGFAVGLRAIGSGAFVLDAELEAFVGEGVGEVGGAVIGEDAFDVDTVCGVEGESLMEGADDAGDGLVVVDAGKAQSGVIVDGDVEGLVAGPFVAIGAVAGAAHPWFVEARELFHIQMQEIAWVFAFIAYGWLWRGAEVSEAVKAVPFEDAVNRGFGDRNEHSDLREAHALPAQFADAAFEVG